VQQVEDAVGKHDPGARLARAVELALQRQKIEDRARHRAY